MNPETPHPGQIGMGEAGKSRNPGKIGIGAKSGEFSQSRPKSAISGFHPRKSHFFLTARTVIADCQRQARLVRFLVGVPGWEKRLIAE